MKQGELALAHQLLKECLTVFSKNHEKRQSALCQYALAFLAYQQHEWQQAREWSCSAEIAMERIGMQHAVEKLQSLQHSLNCDTLPKLS